MGMGIKMHWLDTSRRCVVCRIDEWHNWNQLMDTLKLYQKIAATHHEPPHLIYDFCNDVKVPQPWSMPQLRAFMLASADGSHRTVFVNAPRVLKVFLRMTQQAYTDLTDADNVYFFADSMDEAVVHIGLATEQRAKPPKGAARS